METIKLRKTGQSLILILASFIFSFHSFAQGCVAIRSNGSACTGISNREDSSKYQFATNFRYFKSFRHFRGTNEESNRVAEGSDVRNYSYFLDLRLVKTLNDRWSIGFSLPLQSITRSSLYEHDGKTRHSTSATAIGDARATIYAMLFPNNKIGNIQLGLGVKFATGDYNYQDYFYKNDTTYSYGAVDQSIQPGDGGTGISLELNGSAHIINNLNAYGNAYYMSNPRNTNGTLTTRGGTASATAIKYRTNIMSVADQYSCRGGLNYSFKNLIVGAGLSMEGIPSEDLIGKSDGFRRPGYTVGFEPNIYYSFGSYSVQLLVPVAVKRNRVQSVSDVQRTKDTGTFVQGDAAFADYSINFGLSYRFGKRNHTMSMEHT